jgi:nuclear pore complex protein Nup98-Nup96
MDDKELGSVKNFKVEIEKFGAIEWLEDVDLRGVDLNLVVQIERSKVFLHPAKTNAGKQLNKAAKVSVYKLISASDVKYENNTMKLKKKCEKVGTEFVSYDKKGTFVFKVKKFV